MGVPLRANGGTRGNIRTLREQLERIATMTITVERVTSTRNTGALTPVARRWELWWASTPDQDPLENSVSPSQGCADLPPLLR